MSKSGVKLLVMKRAMSTFGAWLPLSSFTFNTFSNCPKWVAGALDLYPDTAPARPTA
jgi:hypothetical protein